MGEAVWGSPRAPHGGGGWGWPPGMAKEDYTTHYSFVLMLQHAHVATCSCPLRMPSLSETAPGLHLACRAAHVAHLREKTQFCALQVGSKQPFQDKRKATAGLRAMSSLLAEAI